jgi:drug/metabolite transporter (DMT)-like permease
MQDPSPQNDSDPVQAPLRFGLTALIVGNVALAIGPWFVRMADTGPVASGFWRVALAAPLLFLLAKRFDDSPLLPTKRLVWLFGFAGILFAADLAAWHFGILQTKLANANLLGNSTAFLLPLWIFVSTKTLPSLAQGLALALAAIGAGLLMGRSFELSPENFGGDLLCILAGAFYTAYLLLMAQARGNAGPWPTLAWVTAASAPPLLLFSVLLGEAIWTTDWTPLLLVALTSQIIGQGLMIYVIGRVSSMLFALILLIQPVIAAAIDWLVYHQPLGTLDWIGAGLVGLALILVRQPEKA